MNPLIKKMLCRHKYEFLRNVYGDEINLSGGTRSIDKCSKCNKLRYHDFLQEENNHTTYPHICTACGWVSAVEYGVKLICPHCNNTNDKERKQVNKFKETYDMLQELKELQADLVRMRDQDPEVYAEMVKRGLVVESFGTPFAVPSKDIAVDHLELGRIVAQGLIEGVETSDELDKTQGDSRYNVPKKDPKATVEEIDRVIDNTSIYSEAREELLNAQRRQVGYGIDKYPEPLNADAWTIVETLNHDIEETADSLHYKIMLRQKLKKAIETTTIYADSEPYLQMEQFSADEKIGNPKRSPSRELWEEPQKMYGSLATPSKPYVGYNLEGYDIKIEEAVRKLCESVNRIEALAVLKNDSTIMYPSTTIHMNIPSDAKKIEEILRKVGDQHAES